MIDPGHLKVECWGNDAVDLCVPFEMSDLLSVGRDVIVLSVSG